MATIDLSKAKIGDKFLTREGYVVVLKDTVRCMGYYIYRLTSQKAFVCVFQNGKMYKGNKASEFDLVEQVFDETFDTIERDERINRDMQKIAEIADEERQELQRRQEVVELAERIFFSDRGSMYSFKECIEVAEHSVNIRNQYLNDGKLC